MGGESASAVVLDFGSDTIKVGMADQERPTFIKAVVGYQRHCHSFTSPNARLLGEEALKRGGLYTLHRPCDDGEITNFDHAEMFFHHSFYDVLRVAPEEHPAIVTDAPTSRTVWSPSFPLLIFNFNQQTVSEREADANYV